MKAYTDISQSKKLAEILPLESADMYYFRQIDNDYFPPNVESICPIPLYKDNKEDFNYDIPCWSLSALLGIIHRPSLLHLFNGWRCDAYNEERTSYLLGVISDNPVDACVDMILKLKESKDEV